MMARTHDPSCRIQVFNIRLERSNKGYSQPEHNHYEPTSHPLLQLHQAGRMYILYAYNTVNGYAMAPVLMLVTLQQRRHYVYTWKATV